MKKQILIIAIMATLPLTAMAENISGAMYVAPTAATQNNPAPTTNVQGPYGRINIDTADQQNIASTAYVKGAYNSAIAAVNNLNENKQDSIVAWDNDQKEYINIYNILEQDLNRPELNTIPSTKAIKEAVDQKQDELYIPGETPDPIEQSVIGTKEIIQNGQFVAPSHPEQRLMNASAVVETVNTIASDIVSSKRVEIYTTWDNDNAKQQVEFVNAPAN